MIERLAALRALALGLSSVAAERVAAIAPRLYDVVLMDVRMPEMDGLEATRAIVARWPDALVAAPAQAVCP